MFIERVALNCNARSNHHFRFAHGERVALDRIGVVRELDIKARSQLSHNNGRQRAEAVEHQFEAIEVRDELWQRRIQPEPFAQLGERSEVARLEVVEVAIEVCHKLGGESLSDRVVRADCGAKLGKG